MIPRFRPLYLFLLVLIAISIGYLRGVAAVPFHPDESTYLYMSADLDVLLRHPFSLLWQEGSPDPRQHLRLLDPPLVHDAIGMSRRLAGLDPLPVDWVWASTWEENLSRGALPAPDLLLAGRMAVAALFPFSLLLIYLAARRLAGEFTAWAAALLMASNALILLHTRRAMAEGILVFTLALTVWYLMAAEKKAWLAGIPAGLAFCAKMSLAPLGAAGAIAALWQPGRPSSLRSRAARALLSALLFAATVYLLTPTSWQQPVKSFQVMMSARQELLHSQVVNYPQHALISARQKITSLVYQVYYAPPMFAEANYYGDDTRPAEEAYLANPLNTLFRSRLWGTVLLTLTVLGIISGVFRAAWAAPGERRRLVLMLLVTGLLGAAVLVSIPLSWQRYYLPLVPLACLWAAYGADQMKELALLALRGAKRQPMLIETK